ncbi:MAG: hypothetical protein PHO08_18975 [Methylococcales bacterium]|nr:hypothetical protein [Methylococcales bacterium]MDD5631637.1 hypothetical protein [Methylococcales bacterium]
MSHYRRADDSFPASVFFALFGFGLIFNWDDPIRQFFRIGFLVFGSVIAQSMNPIISKQPLFSALNIPGGTFKKPVGQ